LPCGAGGVLPCDSPCLAQGMSGVTVLVNCSAVSDSLDRLILLCCIHFVIGSTLGLVGVSRSTVGLRL